MERKNWKKERKKERKRENEGKKSEASKDSLSLCDDGGQIRKEGRKGRKRKEEKDMKQDMKKVLSNVKVCYEVT